MSISTKRGDTGMTGLFHGGRRRKDSARIECNGTVDEAQSALGYARALATSTGARGPSTLTSSALAEALVSIERDLWVLMAEVATLDRHRTKLVENVSLVSADMVGRLTSQVEELEALEVMPTEFVVPGEDLVGASLDVARTVVRRAERLAVAAELPKASFVVPYLNRLSDLCWLLARAVEGEHRTARLVPRGRRRASSTRQASGSTPGEGQ